jgi:hypothetical protein
MGTSAGAAVQGLKQGAWRSRRAQVARGADRWFEAGRGQGREQRGTARARFADDGDHARGLGKQQIEQATDLALAV